MEKVAAEWQRWIRELPDDGIERSVRYRNTRDKENERRVWEIVAHVGNHSTYHRGQVTTLLRQVGVQPVSTDPVAYFAEVQKQ